MGSISSASSVRKCDEDTQISYEQQYDVCVVATCNNPSGACTDAKVGRCTLQCVDP